LKTLGLIAGQGRLPFMVAAGARKAGLKVVCVGLAGSVDEALAGEVDVFKKVALARPGAWIRKLRKQGVTDTIMVGRVAKGKIFTPFRIIRYLPDWRSIRIWYWRLRKKNKQNETMLNALAEELASGGIILEDSTKYCKDKMAEVGVMTSKEPNGSIQEDIEFGWEIVKKLVELDIGQAIAVKEKEVLSVEGIEGTANMIKRTGQFCKKGGWTLMKVSKANQDMRFDVPCVGVDTIKELAENGGKHIVIEAEKTFMIDKEETIKLADKMGITITGR